MAASILSDYTFDRPIGSGIYGSVIKYFKDGVAYAIKFMQLHPSVLQEIDREIKILYQLNSFSYSIPKLYADAVVTGMFIQSTLPSAYQHLFDPRRDYKMIVMEYIEGPNLYDYDQNHPLDPQSIYNTAVWLFDILRALHALGLVHRDIKPQNIIMSEGMKLYLVDFGFACSVVDKTIQCPYRLSGSPYYIPPEIWNYDWEIELYPKGDVWSAGVTLYEILNRIYPWNVTDAEEKKYQNDTKTLQRILADKIVLKPFTPGIQLSPISDVIDQALVKNPRERPSAEDLYQYLLAHPL